MRAESARGDSAQPRPGGSGAGPAHAGERLGARDQLAARQAAGRRGQRALSRWRARSSSSRSSRGRAPRRLQELRGALEERRRPRRSRRPGTARGPPPRRVPASSSRARWISSAAAASALRAAGSRSCFEPIRRTRTRRRRWCTSPRRTPPSGTRWRPTRYTGSWCSGIPRRRRPPPPCTSVRRSCGRPGRTRRARAALERIVREYPRSDEAALAREQLRTLGR